MKQPASPLHRLVAAAARLPSPLRQRAVTLGFTSQVRFAGTGGVKFEVLEEGRAVALMANRGKVRNHIGGIHAAAMALLAETCTGAVFGLSLPGDKLPLLKTMQIDYLKRAHGGLRAEATLALPQRRALASKERGEMVVPVRVTDAAGEEPIVCHLTWAWVPKKRKEEG
jgi:acyl-coenzyme A thioesterase PaaI-like protein